MESSRFKEILLPLSSILYRSAYGIVKDEDIAKDMVQETSIILWKKRDMLEELESVESYAIKVLRNRCIDYLRSTHIYGIIDDSVEIVDYSLPADELYIENQRLSGVMNNINRLPVRQKQILMLRCVKELSLDEIAKLTGLSNINVRTLLSRARKRLREICESELK